MEIFPKKQKNKNKSFDNSKEPETETPKADAFEEKINEVESQPTVNMQEESFTMPPAMEEPTRENTIEVRETIKAHNKKLVTVEPPPESKHDAGGLKGNPGQQARFNHLMEGKHEGTSKYFHSGKK